MHFNFNKPVEFKHNNSRIYINPLNNAGDQITLVKDSILDGDTEEDKVTENKRFSSLEELDRYVTKTTRSIEDILDSWVSPDGEKLKDLIIQEQPVLTVEQSEHKKIPIEDALRAIFDEVNKPREIGNYSLLKLESLVAGLNKPKSLDEEQLKLVVDAIKNINKAPKIEDKPREDKGKPYDREDFKKEVIGYDLEEIEDVLELKRALILEGIPGTGKTTIMKAAANALTGNTQSKRVEFISFNQMTSYNDFVAGTRSITGVWLEVNGALNRICKEAVSEPGEKYYLLIDELSRGKVESVFGELMTAMEKRGETIITNNGGEMVVPDNLYILATMNITDKSTSTLDIATSDRFAHMQIDAKSAELLGSEKFKDVCYKNELEKVIGIVDKINEAIVGDIRLGENYALGVRPYFNRIKNLNDFRLTIKHDLIPSIQRHSKNMANRSEVDRQIERLQQICTEIEQAKN